jgi:hypothetical protein
MAVPPIMLTPFKSPGDVPVLAFHECSDHRRLLCFRRHEFGSR